MANYPYHNYQQPMMGYQQPMMGYQQPVQPVQQSDIFCRRVSCVDEVRAFPVDFNGSPALFWDVSHGTVYTKAFNPATGESEVVQYQRTNAQKPQTVSIEEFQQLQQTVSDLQQTMSRLMQRQKEETIYEQPDRQYHDSYPQRCRPDENDYAGGSEQPQFETGRQYLERKRRQAAGADSPEYVQGEGYQSR